MIEEETEYRLFLIHAGRDEKLNYPFDLLSVRDSAQWLEANTSSSVFQSWRNNSLKEMVFPGQTRDNAFNLQVV